MTKVSESWSRKDAQRWAQRVRRERVSETGRAMVDLAEQALFDAIDNATAQGSARLYLAVDKLVRASFAADKQHNDNTLEQLRQKLRDGADLARDLEGLAH